MSTPAGRPRLSASRPSRLPLLLTSLCVALALCLLAFGWRGLLVAPALVVVGVLTSLRGVVGGVRRLAEDGDDDFERIRRERAERRRTRTG